MVARRGPVEMDTRLNAGRRGGFLSAVKALLVALVRKLLGGETMMVNEFQASGPAEVWLAPAFSGAIAHRRLEGGSLLLGAGAFLAMAGDLDMRLRWGGLRGLLSREGLFFVEVSGTGDLWITSYGGTHVVDVDGSYVVDNGHLVAFDPALDFRIRAAGGGALGLVASGEGLVCEFHGRGQVTVQARNVNALVGWLTPLLPD